MGETCIFYKFVIKNIIITSFLQILYIYETYVILKLADVALIYLSLWWNYIYRDCYLILLFF